jgi:hypothetical protein
VATMATMATMAAVAASRRRASSTACTPIVTVYLPVSIWPGPELSERVPMKGRCSHNTPRPNRATLLLVRQRRLAYRGKSETVHVPGGYLTADG